MLPFFLTREEVKNFIDFVGGRVKTCLLLETPEAVDELDNILKINGIDYIHVGLNDLHLGYKKDFMFELLTDGTVEKIINKVASTNIIYGFGGITKLNSGDLKAESIIAEHYRLGSSMAILSRGFINLNALKDLDTISNTFCKRIREIRYLEDVLKKKDDDFFIDNNKKIKLKVNEIVKRKCKNV